MTTGRMLGTTSYGVLASAFLKNGLRFSLPPAPPRPRPAPSDSSPEGHQILESSCYAVPVGSPGWTLYLYLDFLLIISSCFFTHRGLIFTCYATRKSVFPPPIQYRIIQWILTLIHFLWTLQSIFKANMLSFLPNYLIIIFWT